MEFTYNKIVDVELLLIEFSSAGLDVSIRYDASIPELVVITDEIQSSVDAVVLPHDPNSLEKKKIDKNKEVRSRSLDLVEEGVLTAGKVVRADVDVLNELGTIFGQFDRGEINESFIETVDGGVFLRIGSKAEANSVATDVEARFSYIFNDGINADLSKGENLLLEEIRLATNQAQLDAVVDTRE